MTEQTKSKAFAGVNRVDLLVHSHALSLPWSMVRRVSTAEKECERDSEKDSEREDSESERSSEM